MSLWQNEDNGHLSNGNGMAGVGWGGGSGGGYP